MKHERKREIAHKLHRQQITLQRVLNNYLDLIQEQQNIISMLMNPDELLRIPRKTPMTKYDTNSGLMWVDTFFAKDEVEILLQCLGKELGIFILHESHYALIQWVDVYSRKIKNDYVLAVTTEDRGSVFIDFDTGNVDTVFLGERIGAHEIRLALDQKRMKKGKDE